MSEDKLFHAEAVTRTALFHLVAYKGNRIIGKILKTLKDNGTFKVRDCSDPYLDEHKIYEISMTCSLDRKYIKAELREEIELMIPELFPMNYQFNFKESPLGFVNSFFIRNVTEGEGVFLSCAHRIKEIKKDGRSNVPQNQIIK